MTKPSLKDFKKKAESKNILEESAKVGKIGKAKEPSKKEKEYVDKGVSFKLTQEEFDALEDKMFENRCKNRSAFIRETLKKALNI